MFCLFDSILKSSIKLNMKLNDSFINQTAIYLHRSGINFYFYFFNLDLCLNSWFSWSDKKSFWKISSISYRDLILDIEYKVDFLRNWLGGEVGVIYEVELSIFSFYLHLFFAEAFDFPDIWPSLLYFGWVFRPLTELSWSFSELPVLWLSFLYFDWAFCILMSLNFSRLF